tara:strand:+ start:3928 stop:4530 length:603 start_codon:yes stop_codon:yes gene_type:complete
MKVKIKKKGKQKVFRLIKSWEDVTLEKWLKLIHFTEGTKSEEAAATIETLSNIPKQLIMELGLKDIVVIMSKIAELQAEENSSLKRIIEVEGKEYGFHPDLDSITLGEYADLEQFIKLGIEKHLPDVMAVLYRPIVDKTENGVYTIEAYDGNITIRAEQMKKMAAQNVQSALVFFYHFANVFVMTSQLSLMEKLKEMKGQ